LKEHEIKEQNSEKGSVVTLVLQEAAQRN